MMGRAVDDALSVLGPNTTDNSQGVAVAFALMGVCGLAYAITRANAVRRTFATSRLRVDTELDLLKSVAREQRRRTAVFAAASALVLFAIGSLPLELDTRVVLIVTPALLTAVGVVTLCRLQMLLGLRAEPALRVSAHGDFLFVARGRRLVGWVAAPPRLVARASRLPVATLRS